MSGLNTPLSGLTQIPVSYGLSPVEKPAMVPFSFTFSAANTPTRIDLAQLMDGAADSNLSMVQGLWIDNSQNANALTIQFEVTFMTLVIPANVQGYFPVFVSNPVAFTVSNAGAAGSIYIGILNFPVPAYSWLA